MDIEIPVQNPGGKPLLLAVSLQGGNLAGAERLSVAPWETLTYTATFSPDVVGISTGR